MALTWWFVGVAWLVALAVGVVWFLRRPPTRAAIPDAIKVANPQRWKQLPRYRALAQQWLRQAVVQLIGLGLIASGGILLTTRLAVAGQQQGSEHNRDIVLCLDVSGSMTAVDQQIMRTFIGLADQLRGERIGLVIWDSTAISIFPLTSDYAFVQAQLTEGVAALEDYSSAWARGVSEGAGSSLIGDGLASCAQRFDRLPTSNEPTERSRTIVLATDNSLAGEPIYTLTQATDLAVAATITVHALSPTDYGEDFAELTAQTQRTGGIAYALDDPTAADRVVRQINTTEAEQMKTGARLVVHDQPLPAEIMIILGLGAVVWAGGRRRS